MARHCSVINEVFTMKISHNLLKMYSLLFMALIFSTSVLADTVKVIPLGSHSGEFCSRDRALIFEDPDGTRLLYDAGRTVAGANDARHVLVGAGRPSSINGSPERPRNDL